MTGRPRRDGPDLPRQHGVAVIVTVFNKAGFVADTLRSVIGQSYPAIELIVVDDGSRDGSSEVVRTTVEHFPTRFVSLQNGGVSRARNIGASAVSDHTEYLLFLDADDVLVPDAVATLAGHLDRHPEAAACYCRLQYVDAAGRPLADTPNDHRWQWTRFGRRAIQTETVLTPLEAVWTNFCAVPSSCLIRRDAFAATAGFDQTLCPPATAFTAEDKDMAIQLLLQGELHRLPQHLLDYRVLPSTHKDALNDGLKALNAKWWAKDLTPDGRARVRRAIRFEYRSAAIDALGWFLNAARHPRKWSLPASTSYLIQAVLRWTLTGPRMNRSQASQRPTAASSGSPDSTWASAAVQRSGA